MRVLRLLVLILLLFLLLGSGGCVPVYKPAFLSGEAGPESPPSSSGQEEAVPQPALPPPPPPGEPSSLASLEAALQNGDYSRAKELLGSLKGTLTDDQQFRQQEAFFNSDLRIDMEFHYLRRKGEGREAEGTVLTGQNPYWLALKVFDQCHLYLLQKHSSGEIEPLFPNEKYSSFKNPVPPGFLRLPCEYKYFYPEGLPGTETIYLVGARWPHKRLEEILHRGHPPEAEEFLKNVEAHAASVPGLVFAEFSLENTGGGKKNEA